MACTLDLWLQAQWNFMVAIDFCKEKCQVWQNFFAPKYSTTTKENKLSKKQKKQRFLTFKIPCFEIKTLKS
jgi:hypothetical protein